jgi:hypothetical protein
MMNQLTQESKSIWRIKNQYMSEAIGNEDMMTFWKKLESEKEASVAELEVLIKKYVK